MKNTDSEELSEVIAQFIQQFYSVSPLIPREIFVQCEPSESENIINWLSEIRGSKVSVSVPFRGEKKKLLDMTYENAMQSLETVNRIKSAERSVMMELKDTLALKEIPRIIECYDISHTAGSDAVGGMVTYVDTHPKKSGYRRFKIESADASDDYGAMSEVIFRRISRAVEDNDPKFLPLPDLILLDGGRGHVATIRNLLNNIGVSIPVFGLVKDDKHKTRELTDDASTIGISIRSPLFKFLAKMQDEVHRYAIDYHKNLHKKSTVHSQLEDIPGVGKAKRLALLEYFKSVSAIKKASHEELCRVKGISPALADNILNYFKA